MDSRVMHRFRQSLANRRENLVDWLQNAPVEERERISNGVLHDVGRNTDPTVVAELDQALARVEEGTFGVCKMGDGDVEEDRLVMDFTTCVCLAHYDEAQLRALERDLEMAAQVQQQLFPQGVPALSRVQIATHATAGRIVGGDYFDFFRFRNDNQGAIIADVMGAGLPAGMLMSNLQASLRILGPDYDGPNLLAHRLNELFRYNLKLIRFISMVLLAFEPEEQRIRYTNAGHNPPLFWNGSTGTHRWLKPNGPAIGLLPEPSYVTDVVETKPGDVLILYTDGLLEARATDGAHFGEDRLISFIAGHHERPAEELVSSLWTAVRQYSDSVMNDDVALLVAKFI